MKEPGILQDRGGTLLLAPASEATGEWSKGTAWQDFWKGAQGKARPLA